MKIFLVADQLKSTITIYSTLKRVFPDGEIFLFANHEIKSLLQKEQLFTSFPIVEYTDRAYYSFDQVILSQGVTEGILFVYTSSMPTEAMLCDISTKSDTADIVYVRGQKPKFWSKLIMFFKNIFINFFIMRKDSGASNKLMYMSVTAINNLRDGTKFRTCAQSGVITQDVYYPKGLYPTKTKRSISKPLIINTIILPIFFLLYLCLGLTITLPSLVHITMSALFILLCTTEIMLVIKDAFDDKILI